MKVLVAFGTRPEQIKLTPVLKALATSDGIDDVVTWCSHQSPDLLGVDGDPWEDVSTGIASVLTAFDVSDADVVVVQGDTATAFACALKAFLEGVPVVHVEAGLRTYAREPFPEEAFRQMIARIATLHAAPDETSAWNLRDEKNFDGVVVTGNPVIDTIYRPLRVLVTLHRRENWGDPLRDALWILRGLDPDRFVVHFVGHPNWTRSGITDVPPALSREEFLEVLERADVVVTDSGGVQEEAAFFGKECIVLRNVTERVTLEDHGLVTLATVEDLKERLDDVWRDRTLYGDGHAGARIAEAIKERFA